MWRDTLAARQLPGARRVAERLARQGTHWADVDHVAREFGVDRAADKGFDLGVLAAIGHAQLHVAGNFLTETHTARAVDASAHFRHGNQRAHVLGQHGALFLVVTRGRTAITHRQVLQLALTALIADRAVERVIDQQELHDRLLGRDGLVALGAHDHALRDGRGAGRHRLGRLFHVDQTHAAVGRDGQLLVIAKMGDVGASLVSRMHDHAAFGDLHLLAVDFDFNHEYLPNQT